MHKIEIPPAILDRARAQRGGRPHLFEKIDLSRTAHVPIDMQNGFLDIGGAIEVPQAREIVPNINAISRALREAGGTNAFLRFTFDPKEPQFWTSYYGNYIGPEFVALTRETFSRGAQGHALWSGLDIAADDVVLDKTRYSGLIPGTCALGSVLEDRGIETLIITGTLTNCCCDSTARDAMQMGYNVIFVSDGTATLTDEEHNATLISMSTIFADVMDTSELLDLIAKSCKPTVSA